MATSRHREGHRRARVRALAAATTLLALAATSCGSPQASPGPAPTAGGETGQPAPAPTETEPAPGETGPEPAPAPTETEPAPGETGPEPAPGESVHPEPPGGLAGDWTAPFELALPGGWTVTGCEGERLDLCVLRDGRFAGDVELLGAYPFDGGEDPSDAPGLVADRARRFLDDFGEDRAAGCPRFAFSADDVVETLVGGRPASRAGFTLEDGDGRVVERVVNYFTVHEEAVWLVNIDAYVDEGGCLGPSEYDPSFQPDDLADFEPFLDALVAGTPLPSP